MSGAPASGFGGDSPLEEKTNEKTNIDRRPAARRRRVAAFAGAAARHRRPDRNHSERHTLVTPAAIHHAHAFSGLPSPVFLLHHFLDHENYFHDHRPAATVNALERENPAALTS